MWINQKLSRNQDQIIRWVCWRGHMRESYDFFLPDKLTIQCQMLQSKVLRHFKKYKSWHTFSNLENFPFMFFLEINFESEMIFKKNYRGQIRTRCQWLFGILHGFFLKLLKLMFSIIWYFMWQKSQSINSDE